MKKYIGLFIALIGIAILAYVVYYQAANQTSALGFVPIGLLVTFAGIFVHWRNNGVFDKK